MKPPYANHTDSELCNARLAAFLSDLPIKDRRVLNSEFRKRFPKMFLGTTSTDDVKDHFDPDVDTPSMFEEAPSWIQEKRKFKFKKSPTIPD